MMYFVSSSLFWWCESRRKSFPAWTQGWVGAYLKLSKVDGDFWFFWSQNLGVLFFLVDFLLKPSILLFSGDLFLFGVPISWKSNKTTSWRKRLVQNPRWWDWLRLITMLHPIKWDNPNWICSESQVFQRWERLRFHQARRWWHRPLCSSILAGRIWIAMIRHGCVFVQVGDKSPCYLDITYSKYPMNHCFFSVCVVVKFEYHV